MEKLVSVIYEFLANILIYVAFFPNGIGSAGDGVLLGVAMLGGIISVIIVLNAIYHNNGRYDFPAKLAIGGIWVLLVTHFAILKVSDLNIMEHVSQIEFLLIRNLLLTNAAIRATAYTISTGQVPGTRS